MSQLSERYAQAAVDAAIASGGPDAAKQLAEELNNFSKLLQTSPELREIIANPSFQNQRKTVLKSVLSKMSIGAIARNLLLVLSDNRRSSLIEEAVASVLRCVQRLTGDIEVQVRSAVSLTAEQHDRIQNALARRLGGNLILQTEVDPSLIGGVVCSVGDLIFDGSLKNQLQRLRDDLSSAD
ncbi:MAG: ATP synthase F1 subunit delta [Myxococcota bacterium]|nr:ATP synthase F1 subunit delta [Myxococcota bacterium]